MLLKTWQQMQQPVRKPRKLVCRVLLERTQVDLDADHREGTEQMGPSIDAALDHRHSRRAGIHCRAAGSGLRLLGGHDALKETLLAEVRGVVSRTDTMAAGFPNAGPKWPN